MKKNYTIIALCIALTICIAFLLWPDKQHDTHITQHDDVVEDHDSLMAHEYAYRLKSDSLQQLVTSYKITNAFLEVEQRATQRKLDVKAGEVKNLVAQIREINQDTAYKGHVFDDGRLEIPTKYSIRDKIVNLLLDSLEQQVKSLTFLITQYESYADSINNVNDSMKIGYDAVIKENNKRITELQSAYDKLFSAYKDLFDTSASLQKDLRRQKLKTKIAAVLGAAVGVLGLVK